MGFLLLGPIFVGAVFGRVFGHWALVAPAAAAVWIGLSAELEGDLGWVVGGAVGVSAGIGVVAGAYLRRSRRSVRSSRRH
jgi:hypothetical protein